MGKEHPLPSWKFSEDGKKMFTGVSRRFPITASTVRHIVLISKVCHIPSLVSTFMA